MGGVDDLPRIEVTDAAQIRTWLAEHGEQARGVWVVLFKKHAGDRYVSVGEVVAEAICQGWIDSGSKGVDADRTSLRLGPRRPGSHWSALNKQAVARLEAEGRIAPAGQRVIDAAREDGSWAWLDDVEALVVPDDLAAALDLAGARAAWDGARPSSRKQALYWVKSAKRAPTRAQRIGAIVERCAAGEPPVAN